MTYPYRVIIAGCGAMANTWADYAKERPDTEIVGLVDLYEEAASSFAKRHNLSCPTFTNIGDALEAIDANIVFDVTIPSSHYHIAMTALQAGCHVFGEKPLAESFSDCTDIVQTARSTGRIQAVMQNRRFDPRIRAYQLTHFQRNDWTAGICRSGLLYRGTFWRFPRPHGQPAFAGYGDTYL